MLNRRLPLFQPIAKRLTQAQRLWLLEQRIPQKDWPSMVRLLLQDSPSHRAH
jgi:hypothetical protein